VIVAPAYDEDALQLLRSRWKNVRLLEVGDIFRSTGILPVAQNGHGQDARAPYDPNELMMHRIVGGFLVQQRDMLGVDESSWKVVTSRKPTDAEIRDLKLAWIACKHVKSNAIVVAKNGMCVGIGGGQVDRVNAARVAIQKSGERARGAVAASDAFFPFPDGPQLLLDAGVTAIIQPGGAMRDKETIEAVDKAGAAMILTGQRHFRH
jgi:phosphoribosylaminoimidazolecarboxamide formyltransferase/IMP cyclohydrolase